MNAIVKNTIHYRIKVHVIEFLEKKIVLNLLLFHLSMALCHILF